MYKSNTFHSTLYHHHLQQNLECLSIAINSLFAKSNYYSNVLPENSQSYQIANKHSVKLLLKTLI